MAMLLPEYKRGKYVLMRLTINIMIYAYVHKIDYIEVEVSKKWLLGRHIKVMILVWN